MAVQNDEPGQTRRARFASAHVFWGAVALALAHLVFVVSRPGASTVELAGFELAVFGGLATVDLLFRRERPVRRLLRLGGTFFVLVGGTWLLLDMSTLLIAMPVLLTAGSLATYGLHRYQLVTLELVEDDDEQ